MNVSIAKNANERAHDQKFGHSIFREASDKKIYCILKKSKTKYATLVMVDFEIKQAKQRLYTHI